MGRRPENGVLEEPEDEGDRHGRMVAHACNDVQFAVADTVGGDTDDSGRIPYGGVDDLPFADNGDIHGAVGDDDSFDHMGDDHDDGTVVDTYDADIVGSIVPLLL